MAGLVNRRGVARREAIIDAAIELWSTAGWHNTSVAAVAEQAGVTDAGLLHHFGTKENLLVEVLAELDRRQLAQFEDVFEHGGLDTLSRLPDMVRYGLDRLADWKFQIVLRAESLDPNGPAHDHYVDRHRVLRELFADAVRTGQANGEIRPDADPQSVAARIIAFTIGAGTQHLLDPDEVDLLALTEDFTAELTRDLAADGGQR